MKKTFKTKAFTLIEVLVVTAVISLLASVVSTSVSESRTEAEDKAKIQEVKQVENAMAIHRNKTGSVPQASSLKEYTAYIEQSEEYQDAMSELVSSGSMPEVPSSSSGKDYFYLIDDSDNGVFGAVLESDTSMNNNNGCYFTDQDVGCSGDGNSYAKEYDRNSLIEEGDNCGNGCSDGGVDIIIPDAMVVNGSGVAESGMPTADESVFVRNGDYNGYPKYIVPHPTYPISLYELSVYSDYWVLYDSFSIEKSTSDLKATPDLANWGSPMSVHRATWSDIDSAGINRSSVPLLE